MMVGTLIVGLALFLFYSIYFVLMWTKSRGLKSYHNSGVDDYTPSLSIVVPTYNEEDTIVHKLRNLMEQDYPCMEIVVVDGASEDNTVNLTEKFAEGNGLHLMLMTENERRGKALALNEAFEKCSGEIIVLTDADVILEQGAVAKIAKNFEDPMIGAVTGRVIVANANQSSAARLEQNYRSLFQILRKGESGLDSTPIFNGQMSAFRRELLTDELKSDTIADDTELSIRIRKKGYRAVYDPEAVVYEYTPITFRSRLEQKRRRGQGVIQSLMRHWRMMFNSKYGKFGLLVLPAEVFMHVISPILVTTFLASFLYDVFFTKAYILLGFAALMVMAMLSLSVLSKVSFVNFLLNFLSSQFILLVSVVYQLVGSSQHKWKKVDEVRELRRRSSHLGANG